MDFNFLKKILEKFKCLCLNLKNKNVVVVYTNAERQQEEILQENSTTQNQKKSQ